VVPALRSNVGTLHRVRDTIPAFGYAIGVISLEQ